MQQIKQRLEHILKLFDLKLSISNVTAIAFIVLLTASTVGLILLFYGMILNILVMVLIEINWKLN